MQCNFTKTQLKLQFLKKKKATLKKKSRKKCKENHGKSFNLELIFNLSEKAQSHNNVQ